MVKACFHRHEVELTTEPNTIAFFFQKVTIDEWITDRLCTFKVAISSSNKFLALPIAYSLLAVQIFISQLSNKLDGIF